MGDLREIMYLKQLVNYAGIYSRNAGQTVVKIIIIKVILILDVIIS